MKTNTDIGIVVLLALILSSSFFVSDKFYSPVIEPKLFAFYFLSSVFFIYYCLKKISFKTPIDTIELNLPSLLFLAYYLLIVIRVAFDKNVSYSNTQFLILSVCFGIYLIVRNELSVKASSKSNNIFVFFGILIILNILHCLIGLFQYTGITHNYIEDFKMGGTFGNPTPFSNLIASILPISLSVILFLNKKQNRFLYYISLVSLFLSLIILPLSNQRTSWVSAVGSSFIVTWYRYFLGQKFKSVFNNIFKKTIFAVVIITTLSIVSLFLYNYKFESAFGRAFIWKISLGIIKDNPLTGVGFEKFYKNINDYKSRYFTEEPDESIEERITADVPSAFNEYIQTAVELGIIGLIILIAGIIIIVKVKVPECDNNNTSNAFIIVAFKTCFISILITSLFSYPFREPSTLLLFFISAGVLSGYMGKTLLKVEYGKLKKVIYCMFLIIIIWFVIDQKNKYNASQEWATAAKLSKGGYYQRAKVIYEKVYDVLKDNYSFLFNYGGELYFMKDYAKSVEILESIKPMINSSNLYINLGSSYEALDQFDKAEKHYLHSLTLVPYKFYPRYKLALLYEKTGQTKKAIALAKETLNLTPKVYHPNIDYVKSKMIEILKANNAI